MPLGNSSPVPRLHASVPCVYYSYYTCYGTMLWLLTAWLTPLLGRDHDFLVSGSPLHTCLSPTLASVAVSEASAQTLSPIGWKSKGTGLYWPHDFQLVTAGVTFLRMRPRIIQRCSQPGKICKQTGSKGGAGQIQSLSFWTGAERGDGQINVFVA